MLSHSLSRQSSKTRRIIIRVHCDRHAIRGFIHTVGYRQLKGDIRIHNTLWRFKGCGGFVCIDHGHCGTRYLTPRVGQFPALRIHCGPSELDSITLFNTEIFARVHHTCVINSINMHSHIFNDLGFTIRCRKLEYEIGILDRFSSCKSRTQGIRVLQLD